MCLNSETSIVFAQAPVMWQLLAFYESFFTTLWLAKRPRSDKKRPRSEDLSERAQNAAAQKMQRTCTSREASVVDTETVSAWLAFAAEDWFQRTGIWHGVTAKKIFIRCSDYSMIKNDFMQKNIVSSSNPLLWWLVFARFSAPKQVVKTICGFVED